MAAEKDILRELEEQAPELAKLLGNTKKEVPYKVPEGYFDTLKMPVKQAPVRKISFIKYAAAAVIAGLIAVTVWFTIQPARNNDINIANISDVEIEKYLEEDIRLTDYEAGNATIKEEDITLMLSDIPDNELETFLN